MVVGADGNLSPVARQCMPGSDRARHVFAYHEVVKSPDASKDANFGAARCDVYYQKPLSPNFVAIPGLIASTGSVGKVRRCGGRGISDQKCQGAPHSPPEVQETARSGLRDPRHNAARLVP